MLKYKILILLFSIALISCRNNNTINNTTTKETINDSTKVINTDSIKGSYIYLDETSNDFGTINKKTTSSINIKLNIKNIGKAPLIILKTVISCGCISTNFTKEPISVNAQGVININVDIKNQTGYFNKIIIIKSNADNHLTIFRITGTIN